MNLHSIKGLAMWYMHLPFRIKGYLKNNERNLARIQKKEKITVVFFAVNVSLWRYQNLYEEMKKNPHFDVFIVLSPQCDYSKDQKINAIQKLRCFFNNKGIQYIDYDIDKMRGFDVKNQLKPDLVFVAQQYYTVMVKEHRYYQFKDSLLCFYPYSFTFAAGSADYTEDFQNRAWKIFLPTDFHKEMARKYALVGDKNIFVTGYPNADDFMSLNHKDVWKSQGSRKKRIIWAPHFTIFDNGWLSHTCFLWMADFMLDIAERYKDNIQIAFKPHPKLQTELYKHADWGVERTNAYYKKWELLENGQLENGSFVDLFMTSDAMIHDSSSFVIEYQYTKKPVMFMKENIDAFRGKLSEFGNIAIDNHYIGVNKIDIEEFIKDVVIKGCDPLINKRLYFAETYLYPPHNKTVAKNTIDHILNELKK